MLTDCIKFTVANKSKGDVLKMSLTQNGVSTTEKGQFAYEKFFAKLGRKTITRYQWDYRDANGILHSGVATSPGAAKRAAAKYGYAE
jgi:hypothetical protein